MSIDEMIGDVRCDRVTSPPKSCFVWALSSVPRSALAIVFLLTND